MNRLPGEVQAQREENDSGNEYSGCGRYGSVPCELGSGDVNDPVKDEEHYGNDGRDSQSSLSDESPQRRTDEEEDEAGQCLGEFLQQLDISPPQQVDVAVNIILIAAYLHFEIRGDILCVLVCSQFVRRPFPSAELLVGEVRRSLEMGCRVQLAGVSEKPLLEEGLGIDRMRRVIEMGQRVLSVPELAEALGLDLVPELGPFGFLESVVLQRDYHLLRPEGDLLQLQGSIPVADFVGLLIVDAAEQLECQVVLARRHPYHGGVGYGHAGVALVAGMVIYQHSVHHLGLVILAVHPEHISVDAVVECACWNVDFLLGAPDVVPQGVNLVEGHRDQIVHREECDDGDDGRADDQRREYSRKGDSGRLHCNELVVLGQLAYGHHGGEQCRQRKREGEHRGASPAEELQYDLESQSLAYEFIDVEPEKLHHHDEDHNQQDAYERSCK